MPRDHARCHLHLAAWTTRNGIWQDTVTILPPPTAHSDSDTTASCILLPPRASTIPRGSSGRRRRRRCSQSPVLTLKGTYPPLRDHHIPHSTGSNTHPWENYPLILSPFCPARLHAQPKASSGTAPKCSRRSLAQCWGPEIAKSHMYVLMSMT